MTTLKTPDEIRTSLELIRGYAQELDRKLPAEFEVAVYYNINAN